PRAPQAALIAVVATVSTAGAIAIDLRQYQSFLILLGAAFVPLFGVQLADWLARGGYREEDVFEAPAFRPGLIGAWVAGFCLYEWLSPFGPGWWMSLVERTHPHASPWGGASLPAFGLSFALAALLTFASRSQGRRRLIRADDRAAART